MHLPERFRFYRLAVGANDAYQEMYTKRYDLIVSDIMMPGIDGFEFARTVRRVNGHIPILFMSARDDLPAKQKGFQLGIDDYMVAHRAGRAAHARAGASQAGEYRIGAQTHHRQPDADSTRKSAVLDGAEVPVTTREFNILFKLLSYPNKTFTRAQPADRI